MNSVVLENMLLAAEILASEIILKKQDQLLPTWIMVNAENAIQIKVTPWGNDNERELTKIFIQLIIKEHQAVAYGFISECWVAKAPEGWIPDTPLPSRPSEDPDRKEAVTAFATDGKIKCWRFWEIKRDHLEKAIELQRTNEGPDSVASWMGDLL